MKHYRAKLYSVCAVCKQPVEPGQMVVLVKGNKAGQMGIADKKGCWIHKRPCYRQLCFDRKDAREAAKLAETDTNKET